MRESQELNHYPAEPHFETARGGRLTKLIAALCASALVVALLAGFLFLRKRQGDQLNAARRAGQTARAAAPIRAQVFQDEVRLRGSEALVGGTVKNISAAPLEGLSIEIELKGRGSRASEANPARAEGRRRAEAAPQGRRFSQHPGHAHQNPLRTSSEA
jgi:hypothetical protein